MDFKRFLPIIALAGIACGSERVVQPGTADPVISDHVLIRPTNAGWQPSAAHILAGGEVEWRISSPNSTVESDARLYLLDSGYGLVDSLSLSSGSATRRFTTPGTYRYCAGGCGDPPEFGVVYVH